MTAGRWTILSGLAVLVAVALPVFLAAACDGGGGGRETTQAGETPAAGETAPADDGGEGAEGAGDEGLQELETLAGAAAEGVIAKVTYRVTTDLDGEVTEQQWLVVQRPPDTRFESSIVEGGEEFRSIIITTGDKSYVCFSGGGEESCLAAAAEETEEQTAGFDLFFDVPRTIAEEPEDVDLVDESRRQIAGVDATCFTITSALPDLGEGEICFSDDGILLLLRSQSNGETTLFEATSVSTDVTDADFEPPYEITELPVLTPTITENVEITDVACLPDEAAGTVKNNMQSTVEVYVDVQFLDEEGVVIDDSIGAIRGLRPGETGEWHAPYIGGRPYSECRAEVRDAFPY